MPKKPVGNTFLTNNSLPTFFGKAALAGTLHQPEQASANVGEPQLYYTHPNGKLWVGDCNSWLESLEPASVDLVFADPPYNIGKAEWDEFESHDEYLQWCVQWVELAARALKPNGSLYVCGFSETLADLRRPAAEYFARCKWLVWFYKNKANLTKDWGRSHESILHYRKSKRFVFNVNEVRIPYGNHTVKYPVHPQAPSSQYAHGKPREKHWRPHPDGAKPKRMSP